MNPIDVFAGDSFVRKSHGWGLYIVPAVLPEEREGQKSIDKCMIELVGE